MQTAKRTIKSIRKVSCDSKLYDIETAKNHNFFANGMLVHNSSATYYCRKDRQTGEWTSGICSRSLDLKPECNNNYTRINRKYDILNKLEIYCKFHDFSLALRGEIYGDGIQGHAANPHAKLHLGFAAFNMYDFDTFQYVDKNYIYHYTRFCAQYSIPTVDLIETTTLTPELIKHYAEDISEIDGKPFEGVVIKHSKSSFKVINLNYDERK